MLTDHVKDWKTYVVPKSEVYCKTGSADFHRGDMACSFESIQVNTAWRF